MSSNFINENISNDTNIKKKMNYLKRKRKKEKTL